jgi:hypothetical protein
MAEYVAGGLQFNLMVAIDFTGLNLVILDQTGIPEIKLVFIVLYVHKIININLP